MKVSKGRDYPAKTCIELYINKKHIG